VTTSPNPARHEAEPGPSITHQKTTANASSAGTSAFTR
jgi:hypothetical protein